MRQASRVCEGGDSRVVCVCVCVCVCVAHEYVAHETDQ
jgi:hypothetical protein